MDNLNWKIRKWQQEAKDRETKNQARCEICKDAGFIIDRRIIDKCVYDYALHCTCKLGKQYNEIMYSFEKYYSMAR